MLILYIDPTSDNTIWCDAVPLKVVVMFHSVSQILLSHVAVQKRVTLASATVGLMKTVLSHRTDCAITIAFAGVAFQCIINFPLSVEEREFPPPASTSTMFVGSVSLCASGMNLTQLVPSNFTR